MSVSSRTPDYQGGQALSRQQQTFAFCLVKVERAMGIETIPGVPLCGFVRVYALVKRTEAHRNPSQLLQTATTRRQWQARKKGQGKPPRKTRSRPDSSYCTNPL